MAWSVQWTDQAIRDLSRLDPPVARRVMAKLDQVAEQPEHFFKRLAALDDRSYVSGTIAFWRCYSPRRGTSWWRVSTIALESTIDRWKRPRM